MLLYIAILLMLYSYLLKTPDASITGVTYMDNFDFEERYRNINECNPLYWHPLHLPDDCAEIFEKAIRSRLKSNVPIRIVRERETDDSKRSPYDISSEYGAETFQAPISAEISYYGHPFRKMLKLLSRDVKDHPRAPTVGLLPSVGLVAVYQLPISRRSEKVIKKISKMYAPSVAYNEPPYRPPYMKIPLQNVTTTTEQGQILRVKPDKHKRRLKTRRKIKKGNVVAYVKKTNFK